MAVNLSYIGGAGWQFFNNNGAPLSGGKIYTYAAGTTTPQTTFTSNSGLQANPNPVILDSAGRTPEQIWVTSGILTKYIITDSDNVVIRTWDNVGDTISANQLSEPSGSSFIGYIQAGFGAIATTVQTRLRKMVVNGDYLTVSQAKAAGGNNYLTIYNPITIDRNSIKEGLTVTGQMSGNNVFMRAFTDTTEFESTTDGAYTSYDTTALIGNGVSDPAYNHSFGYEARHTFRGTSGIDNMIGFVSAMTVNGSAGAKVAASVNCLGFLHSDPIGTGTIFNNSAFYCNDLTRGTGLNCGVNLNVISGTNKYNIYANGTAENYFKGPIRFEGGGTWGANTKISMSGNSGFNFGTNTNMIFAGSGTVSSISSLNDANSTYNPLTFNASITVITQGPLRLKSYTVATLPSASGSGAGATAFVTDANSTTFASVVAGGGANGVPVYSDGTNWRIG